MDYDNYNPTGTTSLKSKHLDWGWCLTWGGGIHVGEVIAFGVALKIYVGFGGKNYALFGIIAYISFDVKLVFLDNFWIIKLISKNVN